MTLTQAKKQAQANADFFGIPYAIFTDTSGNMRIERYDDSLTCHRNGTIVQPQYKGRGVT